MKAAVWRLSAESIKNAQCNLLWRLSIVFLFTLPIIFEKPVILFLDNVSLEKQFLRLLLILGTPFFILQNLKSIFVIVNNVFFHTGRIIAYTDAQGIHLVKCGGFSYRFSTGLGAIQPDCHIAWKDIDYFIYQLDDGSKYSPKDSFIFTIKGKKKEIFINNIGDRLTIKIIARAIMTHYESGKLIKYDMPALKVSRLSWKIFWINFLTNIIGCALCYVEIISYPFLLLAFVFLHILTLSFSKEDYSEIA